MLKTEWITVLTAGRTIDGRAVSDQDVIDLGATYDRAEYTAVINVEHVQGYNMGVVSEARHTKDAKGRTCLQVRLEPNRQFMYLVESKNKLFQSVEFVRNFCGTGRAYLTGLAMTDTPASVGTTQIKLSADVEMTSEKFTTEEAQLISIPERKSFIENFKNMFTSQKNNNKEGEIMDPKLTEALTAITAGQAAMMGAIERLSAHITAETPAQNANASKGNEEAASANEANEALATARQEVEALKSENENLKNELETLSNSIKKQTEIPSNNGNVAVIM